MATTVLAGAAWLASAPVTQAQAACDLNDVTIHTPKDITCHPGPTDTKGVQSDPGVTDVTVTVLEGAKIDVVGNGIFIPFQGFNSDGDPVFGDIFNLGNWTVHNAGHINATDRGIGLFVNASVTNTATGVITGGTRGVSILGTGTVVNAGSISGQAGFGVAVGRGGSIDNQATGTIYGGLSSIVVSGDDTFFVGYGIQANGSTTITNAGSITGAGSGVFLSGANIALIDIDGQADHTLTNTGTITGEMQFGIIVSHGAFATITNEAGGVITGAEAGIGVIGRSYTMNGIVHPQGTVTIINHGEITGQGTHSILIISDGESALTNYGTLNGDVQMGDGDSSVTLGTTSVVNGDIDGGLGINAFHLVGGGAATLSSAVTNFQTLHVDAPGGTWTLDGTYTFTGGAFIDAGTLKIPSGSWLYSDVTVNQDGVLSGSGNVTGDIIVNDGGTVIPGNSIGTLTINGNAMFMPGSNLVIHVTPSGNASLLHVTGNVDLQGGTASFIAMGDDFDIGTTYTIFTTDGVVSGAFDNIVTPFAFLDATIEAGTNAVFLTLLRNDIDFAGVAVTPNQLSVASMLDGVALGSSGDFADVLNVLLRTSSASAQMAFDSLSGEAHGSLLAAAGRMATGQQRHLIAGRIADRRFAMGGMAGMGEEPARLAGAGGAGMMAGTPGRLDTSFWLAGYGHWSRARSDSNAGGFRASGGGAMVGADTGIAPGVLAGAAVQILQSRDITLSGGADSGSLRSWGAHLYGAADLSGGFGLDASIGHLWHRVETRRRVVVGGIDRVAEASYDARQFAASLTLSHQHMADGVSLRPRAGLAYARLSRDGFTETGAGSLNLTVDAARYDTFEGVFGIDIATRLDARGAVIVPALSLAYARAFTEESADITARLAGAPNAPFAVRGLTAGRDRFEAGVSMTAELEHNTTLMLGYQGMFASRETGHGVMAALRVHW